MRGHVRKRGKRWTIIYDEGVNENGKRQQRTKGGFATKTEAQAELTRVLGTFADQSYVQPSKLTVRAFLADEWLPAIAGTVRPLTLTQYESTLRHRVIPRIGHLRLQALSGGHLNALYRELAEGTEEQAGLSPASLRLTHAVLSRAFRDAVRWGKLVRSPAAAADPPAAAESRAHALTAKELSRFLAHVEDDRLFALWRLAGTTGMRRGELLGVSWQWLDLEAGTVRVEQQLVPTRGGVTFGPPKSKRSRRMIALDDETIEALRVHREAQLLERAFAGDAYVDHDLVFADPLGGPIHPQRLTEWFGRHRKAAGITTGTLHVLRHTHTTLLLSGDPKATPPIPPVPLHIVAARIGDRPETMLSVYAHLLPTSDVEAAQQVAALIAR
jgi:integrase